jgi:hypothetical protein
MDFRSKLLVISGEYNSSGFQAEQWMHLEWRLAVLGRKEGGEAEKSRPAQQEWCILQGFSWIQHTNEHIQLLNLSHRKSMTTKAAFHPTKQTQPDVNGTPLR